MSGMLLISVGKSDPYKVFYRITKDEIEMNENTMVIGDTTFDRHK